MIRKLRIIRTGRFGFNGNTASIKIPNRPDATPAGHPRFEIRTRPIHICCGKDLLTGKNWQCPGLAKPFHFGIIETRKA